MRLGERIASNRRLKPGDPAVQDMGSATMMRITGISRGIAEQIQDIGQSIGKVSNRADATDLKLGAIVEQRKEDLGLVNEAVQLLQNQHSRLRQGVSDCTGLVQEKFNDDSFSAQMLAGVSNMKLEILKVGNSLQLHERATNERLDHLGRIVAALGDESGKGGAGDMRRGEQV